MYNIHWFPIHFGCGPPRLVPGEVHKHLQAGAVTPFHKLSEGGPMILGRAREQGEQHSIIRKLNQMAIRMETVICIQDEQQRCNNGKDTWYIGENCDQEWTVLTFALVASLPGVALAAIVGVAVHCASYSKKKKSSSKAKKTPKEVSQLPLGENKPRPTNIYSNPVFASDMQGGQMPQPASAMPSQDRIPMATRQSNPYNYVTGQPPMNQSYNNPQPSRNPYDSADRYEDYRRPTDPPAAQNGMAVSDRLLQLKDTTIRPD
ncbi:hypothetical protein AAFF_G00311910 [Aldrovandia affinis]|uniref:Uncharacterized protein n=1 Tax=Aldrovandia affinis TaxID=143900 RepID=A0AAD7SND5_9TELE|nr:hypothetical protein AAFF_G00311910 [Aldrovandia affinis]